ncbi:hypothetical protein MA16_Dca014524 [Dendrobium catenatum]|uniref:Transmembrane protein n=1 Tax=Dendrobium catenatum TaxID=906689 RepID=A0A2I0VMN2_9ASPA|nr:hypothetical protein MA16_Dca014524 [Dendrobium catenatum]
MVLKANDTDTNSSGSESDDVSFITRKFKSFLRKNHKHHQKRKKIRIAKILKVFLILFVLNAGSLDMSKLIVLHLRITQERRRVRRNPST